MIDINNFLLELFQAHGIECILEENWIVFPGYDKRINGEIVREMPPDENVILQLDVRFEISPQQLLVESFGGTGETRNGAIADALNNFAQNTFHVLIAAFLGTPNDHSAQVEWEVGGKQTKVTVGTMGIRGMLPDTGEQAVKIFDQFEEKIKGIHLVPGTHWARLYYAHIGGETANCEVLLNNDVWESIQEDMATISWPASEDFYSIRVFMVMEVESGNADSPEDAVLRVAEMLADHPEMEEDDVDAALMREGFSDDIVSRAYKFTQTAWARKLLKDIGVSFGTDYLCFGAEGMVIESGLLLEERCFAAAAQICHRYTETPAFKRLVFTSADINALNNAVQSGAKIEDLHAGSAFLFLEVPTEEGIEKAQQTIREHMASRRV